jgi:hypothetical protein
MRKKDDGENDDDTNHPAIALLPKIAIGITHTIQFYLRYRISNQRLKLLSSHQQQPNDTNEIVQMRQRMIEIHLATQVQPTMD